MIEAKKWIVVRRLLLLPRVASLGSFFNLFAVLQTYVGKENQGFGFDNKEKERNHGDDVVVDDVDVIEQVVNKKLCEQRNC